MLSELEQELGFSLRTTFRYGDFSQVRSAPFYSPEDLFRFVDTFYTSTLLYYRTFSIVHFYGSSQPYEIARLALGSEHIEGFEQLLEMEASFILPLSINFLILSILFFFFIIF